MVLRNDFLNPKTLDDEFDHDRYRNIGPTKRQKITVCLEKLFDSLLEAFTPAVVVEVGAFEASFSRRLKQRFPDTHVIAFEANPRAFNSFESDVLSTGVIYKHLAIGKEKKLAEIHIPERIANTAMPYNNRMASLNHIALRDSSTVSVMVPMLPLDEAIEDLLTKGRLAMWVDVEGAVDQVLVGAKIALSVTDLVFCELEKSPVWTGQVLDSEVRQFMRDLGFVLVARDCQKWFQYNAIFMRSSCRDEKSTCINDVRQFFSIALAEWDLVTPVKLFQYWDTENGPAEVRDLMHTWASDSTFEYRAFTFKSAEQMIERHFERRVLEAFRACRIPAMQADLFRLCVLYVFSGAYVDADIRNLHRNDELIRREGRGFLFHRRENLANDIMVVCMREDPLLGFAIERAVENIERRLGDSVWEITGPGILTRAYNELGGDHALFKGFRFSTVEELRKHVGFVWDLEYKKEDKHWTNVAVEGLFTKVDET